jgi:hypothetical protein
MLTPKFGKVRSLIGWSNSVKNPPGEGRFLQMDSAREPAVGNLLPFGRETVALILWDSRDDVARAEGVNGWIGNHA